MAENVNVLIPTIGESISEGTIGRWFFKEGDSVKKDQPLFEVDSDKATLEVPATASGKLKILIPAGKTAAVGALVGIIEAEKSEGVKMPEATTENSTNGKSSSKLKVAETPPVESSSTVAIAKPESSKPEISADSLKGLSPAKRKAVRSGNMPLPGTDANTPWSEAGQEVRKPMSTLRKRIAERLIESQQTTATLTTFNEIDMSNVMAIRAKFKDEFPKKFGVKLGFMSFFARGVIEALNQFPDVNAHIDGEEIIYPTGVNLGVAVSTDRGLVVPVIKAAQNFSYAEIEKKIADLADRAKMGKLQITEMQGGTFTLTNGGTFGSLLSTPIINPPQSGILGMHKIEQRPRAIEISKGKFTVEVRPMMYVALSYDHRLIDGATSVGFLVKVKEYLETVTEDLVMN
ncbi:MAG: 2-oxoglutarate dehydrogenase complex dihydrolipoyllysine-residue succinyltransferase [Deltaproteobacteria bacterium]|nr:2-oxoglutarate dehydrogenase complex dihydrolipoyllysine-residue succinyltransferase [Deltaproteobacteria bacterium]